MKKLQYLWDEINASFWFVPILMLLATIGLAFGFITLDSQIQYSHQGVLKYFFPVSEDSARSILTIIAGAMIGIAGTVFSITLLILTLASSQLGSRLVRNFMYDKLNQVVLGTYVSSFVYCLIVLSSLKGNESFNFVPAVSVFAAIVSAIAGIILLIIFIHHVSMSIQSDKVISDISEAMSKSLKRLFPDDIGQEEGKPAPDMAKLKQQYAFKEKVKCQRSGYLQSVDGEGLMRIAEEYDSIIFLHQRPGDFLVKGMVVCEIIGSQSLGDDVHEEIHDDFIVGKVRTPSQDAEFSIRQMVEVASRALSPGVNDPFTAIACIDNLTAAMCYLAGVEFPSPYRYNSKDKLRLVAAIHSFAGMMNAAFNQIRQYAEGSPSVMIRLMEAMISIHAFARTSHQKLHIAQHAEMVMKAAERTFPEKRDLEDMKDRFKALKQSQKK